VCFVFLNDKGSIEKNFFAFNIGDSMPFPALLDIPFIPFKTFDTRQYIHLDKTSCIFSIYTNTIRLSSYKPCQRGGDHFSVRSGTPCSFRTGGVVLHSLGVGGIKILSPVEFLEALEKKI
jgi:hypothetical protein